jgi:carbamoylphosphate synthase small subunit
MLWPYDYGIKHNILRRLVHAGCRVTVVPSLTSAEDALALKPDGIFSRTVRAIPSRSCHR